ncbi:MAG: aquaporin [Nannocystaceae bacterium]
MKQYTTESIGTFLFVFSVALAVANPGALAPLAIGGALTSLVYMGGPISGGHYNPAVTLAVLLRGKIGGREALSYVLAQMVGAAVGAAVASLVTHQAFVAAPADPTSVAAALVVEVLFTFFLALVVLNTATDEAVAGNSYYGLAIGLTVMVAGFAGGPISGGAFNPAVGVGPAIAAAGFVPIDHVWIYAIGPLLGGALASLAYGGLHPAESY